MTLDEDIIELRDTIDACWSREDGSEEQQRRADHASLDRLIRLARLGAAVEAMTNLQSLHKRGSDDKWEAEDEINGTWSGVKDSPLEALQTLSETI